MFALLETHIHEQLRAFPRLPATDQMAQLRACIATEPRCQDCVTLVKVDPVTRQLEVEYACTKEWPRTQHILTLMQDALQYMDTQYGKRLPGHQPWLLPLFISDVYAYDFPELPFLVLAKPANRPGILVPDNTFVDHFEESWGTTRDRCLQQPPTDKKNVLYFCGANSDAQRQNIRQHLHDLPSTPTLPLQVSFTQRTHVSAFAQYRYLLNLPGNQPWSYRLKYLFLAQSAVIHVDVWQRYTDSATANGSWGSFFDILFEKNVEYINLPFQWMEHHDAFNQYELKKLEQALEQTYLFLETHPAQRDAMVARATRKIHALTMDFVYQSMFLLLVNYHHYFYGETMTIPSASSVSSASSASSHHCNTSLGKSMA
jgi:hypothetical protein